jgi:arylsulfatase A-like enzyme
MMPHRLNAPYNDTPPTPGIRNLGEVFRNAGYRTAWAGKWHAPAAYPKTGGILGFEYTALPRDGNYFLGTCADPVVTEQAIQFLREPHDRPFLLGVSLHNPHDICHWIMHQHTDTLSRFEQAGRRPPLPRNTAPPKNEPEFIQMCRQREYYGQENTFTRDWDEDRWRQYLGVYFAMIEHADAQIGRIDSVLRKRGLYENTLVIFTSDHGEGMAEHRWVVKLMLYDSACSVPFVMRWPGGVSAGAVDSTHLVSGVDIFPTMCDYAGIEIPEGLDGESLRPIVEDPALPGREALVAELNPDPKRPEMEGRMLRTPRYKYMAFTHGKNPEALFDMENDPGETVNIAPDPGALDVLREHRSLLQKILAQTDDRFRMHLGKLRTGS